MFSTIKTSNSSILSIVKCRVQFEFRRGKEEHLWALWSITTTRAYRRLCYKEHVPYCYMKHVTVILVSCKIVIREGGGGGGAFPWKKKDRNPWLVGEPHKYFNFVWSFIGTHLYIPWWTEIWPGDENEEKFPLQDF